MRCLVLGCGTSTGVPLPGCRCSVCTGGNLKNFRNRTSAVIETDSGKKILIDASPDLRHQALRFDLREVHAVVFTHGHSDHILGLDDLRSFNYAMRRSIPCYGSAATISELHSKFNYIFDPRPDYEGGMLPQLELRLFTHGERFIVEDLEILPFTVWHGKFAVSAFRIGKLGYVTDCKVVPEEAREILRECEYLLLDGLQREEHRTHMSIAEACDVAQELKAKKTYLIHMSHSVDYDLVNPSLPSGIELAFDGLNFEF